MKKCVIRYCQLPECILVVELNATTAQITDEEIETLCSMFDNCKFQCKSQEFIIMIGEMNSNVGTEGAAEIARKFGLGKRNER